MKLKRFFTRFFSLSLLMMSLSSFLSPGYIAYAQEINTYNANGDIVVFAEQTEWYYRVVDGKVQRRLWSLTWGKWLTEWEWV